MTYPDAPQRDHVGRRRVPVASVIAGVAVALLADSYALASVPALRAAWSGPAPTASSTPLPTATPTTPTKKPTTAKPTTSTPSTPAPTAGAVKMTDALERGIVLVEGQLDSTSASAGTGMVLTSGGQVLTNYHVVRSTTDITVTVASLGQRYAAHLIGRDALRDVALLQLEDAPALETITVDHDAVALHDPVVAAGNAAGQGFLTAFAGRIVATNQNIRVKGASPNDPEENLKGLLETDAHAEPGDSGGPLFDAQNEVLGMTTAGSSTSGTGKGTAFAVPIANALAVVEKIRGGVETDGVVIGPKASLGVNAVNDSQGVRVTKVVAGSAASRAGLKAGDYVTAIGGEDVSTLATLMTALDTFQPGQTVTLEWRTAAGTDKSVDVALDTSKYN